MLVVGTTYRRRINKKKGSGSNAVLEAYQEQRDAAFGLPFASLSNGD